MGATKNDFIRDRQIDSDDLDAATFRDLYCDCDNDRGCEHWRFFTMRKAV